MPLFGGNWANDEFETSEMKGPKFYDCEDIAREFKDLCPCCGSCHENLRSGHTTMSEIDYKDGTARACCTVIAFLIDTFQAPKA